MPDAVMRLADGVADPAAGLVALEDCSEEGASVTALRLRDSRGSGNHNRAGMGDGGAV